MFNKHSVYKTDKRYKIMLDFYYFCAYICNRQTKRLTMNSKVNNKFNNIYSFNNVRTLDNTVLAFTDSLRESLLEREYQIFRERVIRERSNKKQKRSY